MSIKPGDLVRIKYLDTDDIEEIENFNLDVNHYKNSVFKVTNYYPASSHLGPAIRIDDKDLDFFYESQVELVLQI